MDTKHETRADSGLAGAVITNKRTGTRWLIRRAVSMQEAVRAITHASVRGAVGMTMATRDVFGPETITADVKRLNGQSSPDSKE